MKALEIKTNIENEISYYMNLQNLVKKDFNIIFAIITLLIGLGTSYLTSFRIWIVSFFLMWGIYSVYSFIYLLRKSQNNREIYEKYNEKKFDIFMQLFKPFQEGVGFCFFIIFIILLFLNIHYRTFFIVISLIMVGTTLLYSFSKNTFLVGFKTISKMESPEYFVSSHVDKKGKKRPLVAIILLLIAIISSIALIFLLPFILIYFSFKLIFLLNLDIKLIIIMVAIQFLILYFFISYFASNNAISKINHHIFLLKNLKNRLDIEKLTKTSLEDIHKTFLELKLLKIIPLTIMKIDIWVTIDR